MSLGRKTLLLASGCALVVLTACGEKPLPAAPTDSATQTVTQTQTQSSADTTPATTPATPTPTPTPTPTAIQPLAGAAVNSKSPRVNIIAKQHGLNAAGEQLPAQGAYGDMTTGAIRRIQVANKLPTTGVADAATLGVLAPQLKQGVPVSHSVRALQVLLNKTGSALPAEGIYGPSTQAEVVKARAKAKLPATGIVDAALWAYLFKAPIAPPAAGNFAACTKAINAALPLAKTGVATNNFRVANCLVDNVNKMVAAAARDGITLTPNSSWRSQQDQIRLRRQNCGTTQYDIYRKPMARCNPQTAIPGTSTHEMGLAIDLKNSLVGTPVYNWMLRNGKTFGFKLTIANEPWHWDTKGTALR